MLIQYWNVTDRWMGGRTDGHLFSGYTSAYRADENMLVKALLGFANFANTISGNVPDTFYRTCREKQTFQILGSEDQSSR